MENEELQQALDQTNVINTIQLLLLAFGEVSNTIDQNDQQVMMTRSRTNGQYFMHISGMSFPLDEARLLLSIPEEKRQLISEIDKNVNVIEINKFKLEPFTRINGKRMPNERITLQQTN